MNRITTFFLFLFTGFVYAQTDYSDRWEDFFSYNNVKDIIVLDDNLFALADNAIFTYNLQTEEIEKISSVNGLSGRTTTTIHYNSTNDRLVIGYENGLLEIINSDDTITIAPDIVNFGQTGLKSINAIYEYENKLYLSTAFAVVVYDIDKVEFGDTYFIGVGSTDVFINQITVLGDEIYAATNNGIYVANIAEDNLIDAANWDLRFPGVYQKVVQFNNAIYAVSNENILKVTGNSITTVLSYAENVKDVKLSENNFIVSLQNSAIVYDTLLNNIGENNATTTFDFSLNTAIINDGNILLATEEYGVLINSIGNSVSYTEIHPEGPLSNDVFSVEAYNSNLWVVYGGYSATYTPSQNRQGYSHYNGENWLNTNYDPDNPNGDLVNITIDETEENRVFISAFGDTGNITTQLTGGLYEIENDEVKIFYNHLNSSLDDIVPNNPNRVTIRVSDTALDDNGDLWVTNQEVTNELKKLSTSGEWTSYNLNSILITQSVPGLAEIEIDNQSTKWIATRGNGVLAFNEDGDLKKGFSSEVNKGSLPNTRIESLAIDNNNDVWIGTIAGLVVFYNAESIFNTDIYNAEPVIIEQDGVAERLLGDQSIRSIVVDGANNKWFGTDAGGALNTNSDGSVTLANFSTSNSPLPSDRILKIAIDDSTGKVFFNTDRGIVAYNSNVAPFGDELPEVYAYPNPVLKNNNTVTIDGRNGKHLPENTNVKILDVAGNLVYETNVTEGEQLQGGKVVWDKHNLAGNKVASGIYIVLLATEDGAESITTKIAIVN